MVQVYLTTFSQTKLIDYGGSIPQTRSVGLGQPIFYIRLHADSSPFFGNPLNEMIS